MRLLQKFLCVFSCVLLLTSPVPSVAQSGINWKAVEVALQNRYKNAKLLCASDSKDDSYLYVLLEYQGSGCFSKLLKNEAGGYDIGIENPTIFTREFLLNKEFFIYDYGSNSFEISWRDRGSNLTGDIDFHVILDRLILFGGSEWINQETTIRYFYEAPYSKLCYQFPIFSEDQFTARNFSWKYLAFETFQYSKFKTKMLATHLEYRFKKFGEALYKLDNIFSHFPYNFYFWLDNRWSWFPTY